MLRSFNGELLLSAYYVSGTVTASGKDTMNNTNYNTLVWGSQPRAVLPPGDIWECLELVLFVTAGIVSLASSE